ncbi:hypothetical protein ANCCAN_16177 [Ancylostoma caninum]|uniref:Uncharacterized protein n=1 Tax=Ancylostoma caninum TaxID=29170 RepID=A0A368G0G6_ANCCA|nr:hypothetical protein ANCCAN_16177 [Ancylostoma caninum]
MDLQKAIDKMSILESLSKKLCLNEEFGPVKKYIESKTAMVDFLKGFAKNPLKYISVAKCIHTHILPPWTKW